MILGALLELGAPARGVRDALAKLGIEDLRMRVSRVKRGALQAAYVRFEASARSAAERRFGAIRNLLAQASLPERVRSRSLDVFTRLARAEARVHGSEVDEDHFHEVGAADAIGDIVGVCAALELLGVDRVTASPLPKLPTPPSSSLSHPV